MRLRRVLQGKLLRIPAPWAAAGGFVAIIAAALLVAALMPPPRDVQAECKMQCAPQRSHIVDDKDYPMSKGTYRQVCKCYQ